MRKIKLRLKLEINVIVFQCFSDPAFCFECFLDFEHKIGSETANVVAAVMMFYLLHCSIRIREKIAEGVDHLINPLDNAINEKCSRIKKVLLSMMDEYTASYYIISSHTQKHIAGSSRIWYERLKVITLPRELVIYETPF